MAGVTARDVPEPDVGKSAEAEVPAPGQADDPSSPAIEGGGNTDPQE